MGMRALLVGLLVAAMPAAATGDPICAERPGKATPTCTVEPGHWQAETALADWSLQKSNGERSSSLVLGETLLRLGVSGRSEVQFDLTPWLREKDRVGAVHSKTQGIGDISAAYLHRLTPDDASVQVALMTRVTLPTASHGLGAGRLQAALLVPVDVPIGKSALSLGFTPEIDWAADADGRGHHPSMVQVGSLGWQANDRLTVSAELWRQWDWEADGTVRQASADGSFAYLIGDDVQLDAGANVGLNRMTPDIEFYAGIARHF